MSINLSTVQRPRRPGAVGGTDHDIRHDRWSTKNSHQQQMLIFTN